MTKAPRPKNLIHATVGRVKGLPQGSSDAQYEALATLARKYNQKELPRAVRRIKEEQPSLKGGSCGSFSLGQLSLARNTR